MLHTVKLLRNSHPAAVLSVVLIVLFMAAPVVDAQDYARYQTFDEMTATLRGLVNANRNIAQMESIGKTLEGRDLWLITIANRSGTPVNERPGMLISANFEGDHLVGSQIAAGVVDYLLKNYDANPDVRNGIDNHVFYVMPRVNPDAAEFMFANLKTGRKTNTKEYDGDNDGRMDEDGPDDLNRDGFITVMRVQDTNGDFMIDPDDPRLMKRADPMQGETGAYTLYWEGLDNDDDGFINEDPPGGIDMNRNFQHEYPYYQPDAGWHMVSEFESRAVMDWIIANRNVAVMLTLGESDNLITPPGSRGQLSSNNPIDLFTFADASLSRVGRVGMFGSIGSGGGGRGGRGGGGGGRGMMPQQPQAGGRGGGSRGPATTVNTSDVDFYSIVSDKYIEITGITGQPWLRTPQGAFFQYGYFQYGVLSLTTPGWGIAGQAGPPRRGGGGMRGGGGAGAAPQAQTGGLDKQLLDWMESERVDGFVNWTPFDHPTLGQVEIGGFKPYEVTNPPAAKIAALGEKHGEYAAYISTLYAEVKVAKTEVINHGGGLFRIKAEISNEGFLPTSLRHGVTSRSVKPTMVQLGVKPEQIMSGNAKTNFIQTLAGSGSRQSYEWLITGNSGDRIELKVVAQKGGSDTATITLR
ncbi:M14 family metallopeptidase [candidate division KSB1 bacterium]